MTEPGPDAARWGPVPNDNIANTLEAMLEAFAANLTSDPKMMVQVAVARKLARRIDLEMDGTKLAALVTRFRMVVEAIGIAAPDDDEFDEVARRRRAREQEASERRAASGDE